MKAIIDSKEFRDAWIGGAKASDIASDLGVATQSIYRAARRFGYPKRARKNTKKNYDMPVKFKSMRSIKPKGDTCQARETSFWSHDKDEIIRSTKGAWSEIASAAVRLRIPTRHATARWHIIRASK